MNILDNGFEVNQSVNMQKGTMRFNKLPAIFLLAGLALVLMSVSACSETEVSGQTSGSDEYTFQELPDVYKIDLPDTMRVSTYSATKGQSRNLQLVSACYFDPNSDGYDSGYDFLLEQQCDIALNQFEVELYIIYADYILPQIRQKCGAKPDGGLCELPAGEINFKVTAGMARRAYSLLDDYPMVDASAYSMPEAEKTYPSHRLQYRLFSSPVRGHDYELTFFPDNNVIENGTVNEISFTIRWNKARSRLFHQSTGLITTTSPGSGDVSTTHYTRQYSYEGGDQAMTNRFALLGLTNGADAVYETMETNYLRCPDTSPA